MTKWTEKRFWKISRAQSERKLSGREVRYLENCRRKNPLLAQMEQDEQDSLSFLRSCLIEHDPGMEFENRVLRRFKVDRIKAEWNYWSPAFVGATVAAFAFLAMLQLVSSPNRLQPIGIEGSEVRRIKADEHIIFPNLDKQLTSDSFPR